MFLLFGYSLTAIGNLSRFSPVTSHSERNFNPYEAIGGFSSGNYILLSAITFFSPAALMAQEHAAPATAPTPFIVEEHIVKKISDRVYEIPDRNRPGVPNVCIVIGSRASLVLDTGMGRKSGEIEVREVQRLTKSTELYLATSDFRPEHVTGAMAFPINTIWIVPEGQLRDIHEQTMKYVSNFSSRSQDLASALADVKLREPSIVFNGEVNLDLGGVTVRLMWFGPAHSRFYFRAISHVLLARRGNGDARGRVVRSSRE
jgi:hypothetical protein